MMKNKKNFDSLKIINQVTDIIITTILGGLVMEALNMKKFKLRFSTKIKVCYRILTTEYFAEEYTVKELATDDF